MLLRITPQFLAPAFLLTALAIPAAAQNPSVDSKPQSTCTPAASAAQPAKKPKHVYTDDDFAASRGSGDSTGLDVAAQWSVEGILSKDPVTQADLASVQKTIVPSYQFNLQQTQASIANLYLQQYKDVNFERRNEWEERLFTAFECTRNAQGDYVKELQAVSKDPENVRLLSAASLTDRELRTIRELRAKLIADWNPVRVCNAKFDVIRKEGWQRAEEWLKTHPPGSKTN
jgi:hypothetical protein